MTQQPNQDGVCGNFNSNLGDATTQAIMARIGARVPPSENILTGRAFVEFTPQMEQMMQAECATHTRTAGRDHCVRSLGTSDAMLVNSCTFDMCFGMNVR